MSITENLSAFGTRVLNRLAARRAGLGRSASVLVLQPEPRSIGSFARGRQLVAGNFLFAGHLLQKPGGSIWEIKPPDQAFVEALHGFGWLDDLAAVGDPQARRRAQDWLWEWIGRYGAGAGPGWTPDLAGRRLIRWISHAVFLLGRQEGAASHAFYRSLAVQAHFLARRWHASAPGLPRFEALTGLIYAAISLEGMEDYLAPAMAGLDRECRVQIDAEGGLPTRNPEELLDVFSLLTWASLALSEARRQVSDTHWQAIGRIAPCLRTLRHADGGLARFHGGGRGLDGRLDHALANSGVKHRAPGGLSMGFARLSAGRTSVIIDAAPPPSGRASANAHASTLAFELTSGRRALIVNCGSGASFGQEWRRAGRATPSHSTLVLSGLSSARLGPSKGGREYLVQAPQRVPVAISRRPGGMRFEGAHDGYLPGFGLTHVRRLELSDDGRGLIGEDMLLALEEEDKRAFDRALDASGLQGVPFDIRFHLHPDVDVSLDMGGQSVSMALMSGEIWVLRGDGSAGIAVEPSVYLEKTRLKPRATKQIVLSGRAMGYATRVRWSLAKPQDAPIAIRDLARDTLEPVTDE